MKGALEDLKKKLEGDGPRAPSGQFVWMPIEGTNAMGRQWVRNTKMDQAPATRPQPVPVARTTKEAAFGGRDPRDQPPTHSYERMSGIPGAAPLAIPSAPPMLEVPAEPMLLGNPVEIVPPGMQTDPAVVQIPPAAPSGHSGDLPFYESDTRAKPWWERMLGG